MPTSRVRKAHLRITCTPTERPHVRADLTQRSAASTSHEHMHALAACAKQNCVLTLGGRSTHSARSTTAANAFNATARFGRPKLHGSRETSEASVERASVSASLLLGVPRRVREHDLTGLVRLLRSFTLQHQELGRCRRRIRHQSNPLTTTCGPLTDSSSGSGLSLAYFCPPAV